MQQELIKIEEMLNFKDLKLNNVSIITCDEMQNKFLCVKKDGKPCLGVAYYNYGITYSYAIDKKKDMLYLAIGKNIICFNLNSNTIILNEELQSVVIGLVCDKEKRYVCVVCDLDIVCYSKGKKIWGMGFRDSINDYSLVEESKIEIICSDGKYIFSLVNGKYYNC